MRAFELLLEFLISEYACKLENAVVVGVESAHFEVHPQKGWLEGQYHNKLILMSL